MHILFADIFIKPQFKAIYLKGIIEQTKATLTHEPGCLRFDITENNADPNLLHIYEVFRDEAALVAHRAADYHTSFLAATKDYHAKPPLVRVCKDIFLGQPAKR